MKLLDLKCPNCAAALEVNADLKKIVCNYCGHEFLIDNEIKTVKHSIENAEQIGYDFESGRIKAQRQANAEIQNAIRMDKIAKQQEALRKQEQYQEQLRKHVDKIEQSKWFAYMGVGVILSIIIPYLMPIVATTAICLSQVENVKFKVIAIIIAWVISIAIIGITLIY